LLVLRNLAKRLRKKTIVVMDNASVHTSEEFEACLSQWKKKGLIVKYVTPYSPELNLIEILWRNIKYASNSHFGDYDVSSLGAG
jgi:transposase